MGAIPWWGYLLVWTVSFSAFLTIYFCQINQAVIKNKDGFGFKIDLGIIVAFFLVFAVVSVIPIINIICLLEAFTDQAYEMIYALISRETKGEQR